MKYKIHRNSHGFTIIELLVVIVIIGILSALTLIGYSGIAKQAVASSLSADLYSAAGKLQQYFAEHGTYPSSFGEDNCPVPPDARYCLNPSNGNSYSYSTTDSSAVYKLDATAADGIKYRVTSSNTTPVLVETLAITAIAAISGTTQQGQILSAGALTPSGATASYRWQSATSSGGSYSNISGATSNTYTLVSGDVGKYIKVVATGTGDSSGSATSAASAVVTSSGGTVIATGGTVSDNGGYRTHTFTSNGSLVITTGGNVEISVSGGGGGGGANECAGSGAGGAGGRLASLTYNGTTYSAYGGGGGGGGGEINCGAYGYGGIAGEGSGGGSGGWSGQDWDQTDGGSGGNGSTTASSLTGTTGGGSAGGAGENGDGYCDFNETGVCDGAGGNGGAGGKVTGTINASSGQTITIVVSGASGNGTAGIVTIRYPH